MTRARALILAAAAAVLPGLLLAGAAHALPAPLRLTLAFVALLLAPGAAFVALGASPPGGAWTAPGWAFGFGLAWCSALLFATRLAGVPFLTLLPWTPLLSALPWLPVVWRAPRLTPAGESGLARWAGAAVVLAAALAAFHSARFGPPMGLSTDAPDHIGTLRRMLMSGDLFPADAFFRDAGPLGADPRKGLWHGVVALMCRLGTLDPVEAWRWLPALIVPLFVLEAAALGMLVRGPTGAALGAWALVLTYGASMLASPIRQAVYASRVGDQLALATAVAVLADLRAPSRANRLAALALGFAAVAAHIFTAVQFALVFGALGVGLLVRDRGLGPQARRLAVTGLLLAAACLPYLLFRAHQGYAPSNPIHTEPQGLLLLGGGLCILPVGELWAWMGMAWVLVPLAWPRLWSRGRRDPAVLFLLTSSLVVPLVIYDPLAVGLLEPRVGYLLMRMVWLVPLAGILAWLLPELAFALRSASRPLARVRAGAELTLALALLAPAVLDAARALAEPERVNGAESREYMLRWGDAFDWMRDRLPRGSVVLSDPATSYAVPMLTGLYVATLVDQHSSPNDSLALRRILDSRDALDPFASWVTTAEVVRRYGVDVIVLNGRFKESPRLDYWAPSPRWFRAARARLDARPDAFVRAFDSGDLVIYRVRREVLDTLAGPPPRRPYVAPWVPGATPPTPMGDGLPDFAGLTLDRRAAAQGEVLTGVAQWHAAVPAPAGSYQVAVRFDRPLPDGLEVPIAVRKPVRKVVERLHHERYRFRDDHLPTGGQYGVDLWRPNELVRDSFALQVPRDVADGTYRVEVRLFRQPHYPNYRVRDFLSDDDCYSGVAAGTLTVRRAMATPTPGRGAH